MSTDVSIIAKNPRGHWGRYYFAYERQMLPPKISVFRLRCLVRSLGFPFSPSRLFLSIFLSLVIQIHRDPTPLYVTARLFHYPNYSGSGCRRFRYQRPQAAYGHRWRLPLQRGVFECIKCTFLYQNSRMSRRNVKETQRDVLWTVYFRESRARLSTSSNWFPVNGCNIADCVEYNEEIVQNLVYELFDRHKINQSFLANILNFNRSYIA